MDNQELLEQLQQLQSSLQDIEAARQMVSETIEAYNGVSTRIESYSSQLSSVSDRINLLIAQISQNRETLSSEIDSRMEAALEKAEQASEHFSREAKTTLLSLEDAIQAQIRDLKSNVESLLTETRRAISDAIHAANEVQSQSIASLDEAGARIEAVADGISKEMAEQLNTLKESVNKRTTICCVVVSIIVIACFAVLLLR